MPAPQARPSAPDDCPVSLDVLGTLYRGDSEVVETVLADIPSGTRARLAAYLYGKSHLHALGLRVASACTETDLVRVAGHAGAVLFAQSRTERRPAETRIPGQRRISLAGSRAIA
ncbi:hypothetical protein NS228_19370 [Methylobacterium indicum]|uniref:Uncharacterized protein n=1 Tax=Methylobacterium indicum TaxID=1775910 RepID=A0A0J6RIN3_9HYPH|nr:hypothetical protein [Methylobacterium indicum]KMO21243.1 hypothetical protein QR79_17145 [Methylobacterium indicum]KMO21593.1 hypothetical protein QR78_08350 [Methylobacterium indicum]KTS23219.1 hypothetical protein NS229_22645 [Methylobacterium indicum]KTS37243.1 hypothetical protein NS228_19370 [Methylobacterium indicum]KTS47736.1 hypothetical protein NS230_20735 [Methylobacterium indicum]